MQFARASSFACPCSHSLSLSLSLYLCLSHRSPGLLHCWPCRGPGCSDTRRTPKNPPCAPSASGFRRGSARGRSSPMRAPTPYLVGSTDNIAVLRCIMHENNIAVGIASQPVAMIHSNFGAANFCFFPLPLSSFLFPLRHRRRVPMCR
ncbi:hypothetical protein K505DRAFT_4626 [Melanomma pulvis-pyrius CBS 109.77]|uniref:Uncharacterized protein n=1 Tax=Melanomma pulvis-pyrius CBS 109.77 TaxID=1314802 RepID=A0A6A6XIT2_9PLEO|nr:hypothetical protein K505DRAFT_4626 [Melanomma pulvis-pyrius CBS 109.77]